MKKTATLFPVALSMALAGLVAAFAAGRAEAASVADDLKEARRELNAKRVTLTYLEALHLARRLDAYKGQAGLDAATRGEVRYLIGRLYRVANRYSEGLPEFAAVCADESLDHELRGKAYCEAAEMLVETLRRGEAMALLDRGLEMPRLPRKVEGLLLMTKARLQLTPSRHEEVFSVADIDVAYASLKRAFAVPGISAEERYEALRSIADAYQFANAPDKVIEVCGPFAESDEATPKMKGELYTCICDAYRGKKEYRKMLSYARRALEYPIVRSDGLMKLGEAARMAGDWKTAQQAYSDLLPLTDKNNSPLRYQFVTKMLAMFTEVTRNGLEPQTAEEVFDNGNGALGGLELDE